ncbi:phage protein Gp37 [Pseudomonas sp.]|uniref:phage protein Gp37 n=1 Tax=Pseudomonas sp. TaxID=306 RepID=UPI003D111947
MITAIEDDIIERVKGHFGAVLRTVDSVPGPLDSEETLKKMLRAAPAVFVLFAGGRNPHPGKELVEIRGRWVLYAVTAHAGGQADRRRGDGRQIGAYEIVERLVPLLSGFCPADESALDLADVANLYSGTIDNQGVTIYAVNFGVRMDLADLPDVATLDDFLHLHTEFDHNADGAADLTDDLLLGPPVGFTYLLADGQPVKNEDGSFIYVPEEA